MAIASFTQPPGGQPGVIEQSMIAEIIDYANQQSNGQLVEQVRTAMVAIADGLRGQAGRINNDKANPLKWLLEDKTTSKSLASFHKVFQKSLKLYCTELQDINVKVATWSVRTSQTLEKILGGFSDVHNEVNMMAGDLRTGRNRIRQMVDGIIATIEPQTETNNVKAQSPSITKLTELVMDAVESNRSNQQTTNVSLSESILTTIESNQRKHHQREIDALTNILGATLTTSLITSKVGFNDVRTSTRILERIATIQEQHIMPSVKDILQHLKHQDKVAAALDVEAQQDAKYDRKIISVLVSQFSKDATTQLAAVIRNAIDTTPTTRSTTTNKQATTTNSAGGIVGSLAKATGIAAIMGGAWAGLKTVLQPVLRRLPIIGTIINFGLGIQRLAKGDVLGGITQMGAGLAYMFPSVGTALGLGIDALLYWRDQKGGGAEGLAKGNPDIFKQAWGVIKGKLGQWWDFVNTTVTDFFTETIPSWLDYAGKQLNKAFVWFTNPTTLKAFSEGVDKFVTSVREFISGPDGLSHKIVTFFSGLKDVIPALGNKFIEFLTNINWTKGSNSIVGKASAFINASTDYIAIILEAMGSLAVIMGGLVKDAVFAMKDAVFAVWKNIFASATQGISQLYTDYVKPIIDPIVAGVQQFPGKVWTWFKDSPVGKFLFSIFGGITKIINGDFEGGLMELMPESGAKLIRSMKSFKQDPRGFAASALDNATGTQWFSKAKKGQDMILDKMSSFKNWITGEKPEKHDDVIITSKGKVIKPHKDDNIWAAKAGGPIDKAMDRQSPRVDQKLQQQLVIQLQKALQHTMERAISDQSEILAQVISQINAGSAGAGVSNTPPSRGSDYQGERDPNYIHRMKAWHSLVPPARVAY